MNLKFYKYQAAGNDFILIDFRKENFSLTSKQIKRLCDRRFGIGADGLIIINESSTHDFNMDYYNSDGNIGSMCGNGGRSIVMFAKQLGIISGKTYFNAIDGIHYAEIISEKIVKLKMIKPAFPINKLKKTFVDTGSPHFVKHVDEVSNIDVCKEGKLIRHSDDFFEIGGTNVNFVEQLSKSKIYVRTFERGVEEETLSCGTGVVASSILMHMNKKVDSNKIEIETKGGDLLVEFDDDYENVYLIGPAENVFKGEINL